MKKVISFGILIFLLISFNNSVKAYEKLSLEKDDLNNGNNYEITMKQDILCLMMTYPEYAVDVIRESDGKVYLVMKSGRKILYDDKRNKNFDEKFARPDLQDMMEQVYPLTSITKVMDKNFDPGRIRVYSLLNEVYGPSKGKVESNLKNTNLGYRYYQFNKNNRAADSLKNAMNEIVPMANSRKDISACLFPSSGTYNYRVIAGTGQLSPHSYGIAIDLARDRRDYWKWVSPEEGSKRIASYPKDMVQILEKNNFVWGGKWSHFDTLHFEYRPEIIMKAKYFSNQSNGEKQWYDGVNTEDSAVKSSIEKIDNALK